MNTHKWHCVKSAQVGEFLLVRILHPYSETEQKKKKKTDLYLYIFLAV